MKRIGSALLMLVFILSMASLAVFAEEREIDLTDAYTGEYYHQEATIADVLAGTGYEQFAAFLKIEEIKVVSGQVPPGLEAPDKNSDGTAVVFKGTPTTVGKYTFVVEVTGRILINGQIKTEQAKVNLEVKEGKAPDDPPVSDYEKPQFVTEPFELYELNKGGMLSVQVSAKCAEKCNFALYVQNGNNWNEIANVNSTNSCTLTAYVRSEGTYTYKAVAYNSEDEKLFVEKSFTVKAVAADTAPTYGTIEGVTEYSVGNAMSLTCKADGTAPTYSWYIMRRGSNNYLLISTSKTLSYIVKANDDGATIKCKVENSAGEVWSNEVTITLKAAHTHSYGAWTATKNPTCTMAGLETRSCSCGEKETRTISATGHSPRVEWVIDSKATCVSSGSRSIRCSVCNDKVREESISATGHSFNEWKVVKAATAAEEGIENRSCKNCSATETQTIPKLDGTHTHSFGDWTVEKEVGCTEDGRKSRKCSCGYVQNTTVTAEGHKYSTTYMVVTAPTCTVKGQKAKQCLNCGEYSVKLDIDATGHAMSAWEVVISPTYESEGLEMQKCTNTGCTHRVEKTIAKLVSNHTHMFSEWIISVAPTCKEKGAEKRSCSCGAVETNDLEMAGHTFGAWEVTLAPTTARDGVETRTCADCPKAERRAIHKLSEDELPVTPVPTPDATPTVTPEGTADNTGVPETSLPQTGTNNTQEPSDIGGDEDSLLGTDMVGIVILLAILAILAVVVFSTIKIFIKA